MARAERTVYRLLTKKFTKEELTLYFSPSPEESLWAMQMTKRLKSRLCLLVNLKIFQYLGYFSPPKNIPEFFIAIGATDGGSEQQ